MTICYYPPTKQDVVIPQVSNNEVKLYSSSLPLIVAPAIIVLNNILKMTISVGWALVILGLIQSLLKLAKSKDRNEFEGEIKRIGCAALLMWILPYVPPFIDSVIGTFGDIAMKTISGL